jgi:hypothetical protein
VFGGHVMLQVLMSGRILGRRYINVNW